MELVEERRGRRKIHGSTSARGSMANARAEADASIITREEEVYSRGNSEAVLIARQHQRGSDNLWQKRV
jgi:hypothetical protein